MLASQATEVAARYLRGRRMPEVASPMSTRRYEQYVSGKPAPSACPMKALSAWAPLTNDATASAVTGMRCRARKSSLGMKMLVIMEFSASAMASTTEFMKSA